MCTTSVSFDSNIISALIQVAGMFAAGSWIAYRINLRSDGDIKRRETITSTLDGFADSIAKLRDAGLRFLQAPNEGTMRAWAQQRMETNHAALLVKSVCFAAYNKEKAEPFRGLVEGYYALKVGFEAIPAYTTMLPASASEVSGASRKFSGFVAQVHKCKLLVYTSTPPGRMSSRNLWVRKPNP